MSAHTLHSGKVVGVFGNQGLSDLLHMPKWTPSAKCSMLSIKEEFYRVMIEESASPCEV